MHTNKLNTHTHVLYLVSSVNTWRMDLPIRRELLTCQGNAHKWCYEQWTKLSGANKDHEADSLLNRWIITRQINKPKPPLAARLLRDFINSDRRDGSGDERQGKTVARQQTTSVALLLRILSPGLQRSQAFLLTARQKWCNSHRLRVSHAPHACLHSETWTESGFVGIGLAFGVLYTPLSTHHYPSAQTDRRSEPCLADGVVSHCKLKSTALYTCISLLKIKKQNVALYSAFARHVNPKWFTLHCTH